MGIHVPSGRSDNNGRCSSTDSDRLEHPIGFTATNQKIRIVWAHWCYSSGRWSPPRSVGCLHLSCTGSAGDLRGGLCLHGFQGSFRKARVWWLIRRSPRGKDSVKRSDLFGDTSGELHLPTALSRQSSSLRCLSSSHFFSEKNLLPRFRLHRSCWLAPLSRLHVEFLLKGCGARAIRRFRPLRRSLCTHGCSQAAHF